MSTAAATREINQPFDSIGLTILFALVFGIAAFATDMYLPAFPAIRARFSADPNTVQYSLSLFLYGNAFGHLIFGPLSDRYGRKPILLIGLGAYCLASFGCASADSGDAFIGARLLQGAAAASGPVLVRAIINDCLERDRAAQMLALLTGMMAFTAMLSPTIGGLIVQAYSWNWIFYGLGCVAIALLCATWWRIPETHTEAKRQRNLSFGNIVGGYAKIMGSARFWLYVLPPSLMFAGIFAYASINSFLFIDDLGLSPQRQGMLYSVAAAAFVSGSFASRLFIRLMGINRALNFGLALGLLAALGSVAASALFSLSLWLVLIPGVLTFFATALVLPIGFSVAVSLFPERAGSASAIAGCTQLVCAGFSTGLSGYLYDGSTVGLHNFVLAVGIGACALWVGARRYRL